MAATANRQWFVNWFSKSLQISDTNGGAFQLPNFHKYETIPLKIVIVEPDLTSKGLNKFARVDVSGLSLTVSINETFDDAAPLVQQATWAKDEELNCFQAELPMNTAAMNSYLGASDTKTAYLEIEVQEGTARSKILVQQITIQNSVTQIGTITPAPVDEYFTKAQTAAQFWPMVGAPGAQLTITSPSNTYNRILGVDDGGAAIDIILPV